MEILGEGAFGSVLSLLHILPRTHIHAAASQPCVLREEYRCKTCGRLDFEGVLLALRYVLGQDTGVTTRFLEGTRVHISNEADHECACRPALLMAYCFHHPALFVTALYAL